MAQLVARWNTGCKQTGWLFRVDCPRPFVSVVDGHDCKTTSKEKGRACAHMDKQTGC